MIELVKIHGYRLFDSIEIVPQPGMNIVVGDNESGKSTLLEAMILTLTGRVNGRWAREELNPYWFHQPTIIAFFASFRTAGHRLPYPFIQIEIFLSNGDDGTQHLRGVHNSRKSDQPGVSLRIAPAEDYASELEAYVSDETCPAIIPTEYYDVEWRDFADSAVLRKPKGLGVAAIDSRTIRSSAGVDYHTRELLGEYLEPSERAAIAVAHRKARHAITEETLHAVNDRITAGTTGQLHDKDIGLHMDQSSSASWESGLVPQVANIPFAMSGQGQQAAVKVALALNRSTETTAFALIEEPENHLSHTNLTRLVGRISALAGDRQVFVTTHSSYVLNRLGINSLILLHLGGSAVFNQLPADTVDYFKKLSGYDTLRLVLGGRIVLVEGPSDEILLTRAYLDRNGVPPPDRGIDVISMHGLALRRCLQLCQALQRRVAILRDNDNQLPDHWRAPLESLLESGHRELFIGEPRDGTTLEPQMINCNEDALLRRVLGLTYEDLEVWMTANKTESALRISESKEKVNYPHYFQEALDFLG